MQLYSAVLYNANVKGFVRGNIYTGSGKKVCVPGLNCYSCPGAIGACPLGSLQNSLATMSRGSLFYVVGTLMLFGLILGRTICGWLCPFGLIQELLHKIPFPKKIGAFRGDRLLRKLKYAVLIVLVILLPLFLTDILGQGAPWFCKVLCPAGTLEGGLPLVLLDRSLRGIVGWLYAWKVAVLVVTLLASVVIYRPFCKYLCPLGALYSVFNPISVFRCRVDREACVGCGVCAEICPMQVDPVRRPNDPECIRCGRCRRACPAGAITFRFRAGPETGTSGAEPVQMEGVDPGPSEES